MVSKKDSIEENKKEFFIRLYSTVGAEHGERGLDIGLLIQRYKEDWHESLRDVVAKFGYTSILHMIQNECSDLRVSGEYPNFMVLPMVKEETRHQMGLINQIEEEYFLKKRRLKPEGKQGFRHNIYPVQTSNATFEVTAPPNSPATPNNGVRPKIDLEVTQRFIKHHITNQPRLYVSSPNQPQQCDLSHWEIQPDEWNAFLRLEDSDDE